jgi:hypothetical protein
VEQNKTSKMKAKELRLGNYVSVISDVLDPFLNDHGLEGIDNAFKVVGIDSFHINVSIDGLECEVYLYEYKPILLTEEWLIKFGFEKDVLELFNLEILKDIEPTSEIIIDLKDFQCEISRNKRFGITLKMQYVHQLQNLYFDLTDEELTIKQD